MTNSEIVLPTSSQKYRDCDISNASNQIIYFARHNDDTQGISSDIYNCAPSFNPTKTRYLRCSRPCERAAAKNLEDKVSSDQGLRKVDASPRRCSQECVCYCIKTYEGTRRRVVRIYRGAHKPTRRGARVLQCKSLCER